MYKQYTSTAYKVCRTCSSDPWYPSWYLHQLVDIAL